jgi:hypothetical protein
VRRYSEWTGSRSCSEWLLWYQRYSHFSARHLMCNVSVTDAMASSAATSSYTCTERSCLCGSVNAPSASPSQHASNTAKCKICRTKPKFCFFRGQRSFDLGQQGPSSAGEFLPMCVINVSLYSIQAFISAPSFLCSPFLLPVSSILHVSLPSARIRSFSIYVEPYEDMFSFHIKIFAI